MLIKEANERERKVSLVNLSFLKKVTAILVISALVMLTAVASASAGDLPYTSSDICVNETGWWRDGGAFNASGTPIQDAVNNAHSGETICVKDGMYAENVDVNVANLTIKSENGSTSCIVQAASTSDHVFEVTADYVNITGFTAKGATNCEKAGIYLDGVEHCDISDNKVSHNNCGIYLSHSSYNSLTGNNASNNNRGIYLWWSSKNNLTNNTVSNNDYGIYLCASISNNFTGNTFVNDGLFVSSGYHNTVENNTVNGKPLVYLEDTSDYMVPDAGQVILVNCNNVTVENLDLSNTTVGVGLWETTNSTITNNTANSNNYAGIELDYSSNNNTLTNNTVSNNEYGICLWQSSNNTLNNNTMSGNTYNFDVNSGSLSKYTQNIDTSNTVDGKPVYYWINQRDKQIPDDAGYVGVVNSTNITVKDLTLSHNSKGVLFVYTNNSNIENVSASNNDYGIYLWQSSNNNLTNNTANSNNGDGIKLCSSSNNNLTGNIANSNNGYGIYLDRSSNNNHILNNNCSNHRYGIVLYTCTNNNITNNSCSNNEYGIGLWQASNNKLTGNVMRENGIEIAGYSLSHYANEIDTSNTVNGKPVYYWNGVEGGKIPGDAGQVILVNCSNVTVENQNLNNASIGIKVAFSSFITIKDNNFAYNWYKGISLEYSSNNSIINNSCSYNHEGIKLRDSSNNSITSNNCSSNSDEGIMLDRWSYGNSIANNTCVNNRYGISLCDCPENNSIANNNVLNNNEIGINLWWDANNNTLTNNIVSNNKNGGILFFHASNNILHNNSVTANSAYGIKMERWSNNNTLTDNTALNNTNYDFNSDETSRDNVIADFTISPTTISFIYEHGIGIKSVTTPELPDPAGKANISKYVNVTNETEDSWILLNVSYSDADVTNVKEDGLRLYRWTGTDWAEIAGSAVNTAENYVYANVTSFSQIAPFGDPISTPTPRPRPPGGGTAAHAAPAGETSVSTETTGEVKSAVTAPSADGKASVVIPKGTVAKDAASNPLTKVTVAPPSVLPAGVPSGVNYVAGYAYDFGPEGATFDPAIEITITFDATKFEGRTPAIYTYEAGAWKTLDTTVVGNKATAKVTHFSTFVLFAAPEVTPTSTPAPTPVITPTLPPTATPTPTPTSTPTKKPLTPGFEVAFAIAGLLAVVYLALRRKQ